MLTATPEHLAMAFAVKTLRICTEQLLRQVRSDVINTQPIADGPFVSVSLAIQRDAQYPLINE